MVRLGDLLPNSRSWIFFFLPDFVVAGTWYYFLGSIGVGEGACLRINGRLFVSCFVSVYIPFFTLIFFSNPNSRKQEEVFPFLTYRLDQITGMQLP